MSFIFVFSSIFPFSKLEISASVTTDISISHKRFEIYINVVKNQMHTHLVILWQRRTSHEVPGINAAKRLKEKSR